MEKTNPNYIKKVQELKKTGGIISSTDILVPLVTNRDRFPNADKFLPKFILLSNDSVLELKTKPFIIKYKEACKPLTMLILFESWRTPTELDAMEGDPELVRAAFLRKREVFPFAEMDSNDIKEDN